MITWDEPPAAAPAPRLPLGPCPPRPERDARCHHVAYTEKGEPRSQKESRQLRDSIAAVRVNEMRLRGRKDPVE